jgi:tRNA nucleotidyltransferase/poly(A) polymerase
LDRTTKRSAKRNKEKIRKVSPERIQGEILKAAGRTSEEFARFILVMDELQLLQIIFPEVSALKYFKHDREFHPEGATVFDHVIAALRIVPDDAPAIDRLAVLFHDVGKAVSFQEKYGWKLTYHKHEHASAQLAEDALRRYRFSTREIDAVVFAAENHMKFLDMPKMRPSKIAQLATHPYFSTLVTVARADEFSRGEVFMRHEEFDEAMLSLNNVVDQLRAHAEISKRVKIVSGDRVMLLTGLKPGPMVGKVIRASEDYILNHFISSTDEEKIDEIIVEIHKGLEENTKAA